MNNYVVIEGDRYDFKNVSKITEHSCSVCALKNFCCIDDTPCSVFNASNILPHSPQYAFVKHVKNSNNGKEIIKNKVMAKYIDKDALVAEINKRIIDAPVNNIGHQRVWAYNDVKDIIDNLEVKEMDLDEEADNHWGALSSDVRNSIYYNDYYKIAKHFFELGLKLQNGD